MRELHLLCNAHLDPMWLWRRQEGIAEAISTFRVAAAFCEEFDGFVFNHNESILYEWVEEHEPELFQKIRELVKAGKWKIMGGWYLQPECMKPSGEGFIRQIEEGQQYFMEKFGVKPTAAISFDTPGHSRGLVQILKKWGYDSYLFFRGRAIPQQEFIWRGYDGSEILAHTIYGGYNTQKGAAVNKIERVLTTWDAPENEPVRLVTWGIGNHGGGASMVDLQRIAEYQREHPEVKLIHSCCEDYVATVDRTNLPVIENTLVGPKVCLPGMSVEESLGFCLVGCYTSMVRINQKYRRLENELVLCEKMLAQSGVPYDEKELSQAQKALLFTQNHDILCGSLVRESENEALQYIDYGREILAKLCTRAFFAMCRGQKAGKTGEIPVLVYNPHPYPVEEVIEVEFQLEDQNWAENQVTLVSVRDEAGYHLPTQNEKEDSSINLDWRKRIAFQAVLKPMSMNRFDCELRKEAFSRRPIDVCQQNETHFIVKTDEQEVLISKTTGLLDKYEMDGKDYLKEGSAAIRVYKDGEDGFGMTINGYYDQEDVFRLVSKEDANRFNGYPESKFENVRVIENGSVRCKIQAILKYSNSWAVVTYSIPKKGRYVDIKIKMYANDANKMFKLAFETTMENDADFVGQTAFGREVLRKEEREEAYQKWCALMKNGKGFAVLNRGTYGGSAKDSCLNISLMHTPLYCGHPIMNREIADRDRNHDHVDMGEREFEYRITPVCAYLDTDSEIYNQQAYAWTFFPSGLEAVENTTAAEIAVSNKHIVLTSLRKAQEDGLRIRLFNESGFENQGTLAVDGCTFVINLNAYEVKTYLYNAGSLNAIEQKAKNSSF